MDVRRAGRARAAIEGCQEALLEQGQAVGLASGGAQDEHHRAAGQPGSPAGRPGRRWSARPAEVRPARLQGPADEGFGAVGFVSLATSGCPAFPLVVPFAQELDELLAVVLGAVDEGGACSLRRSHWGVERVLEGGDLGLAADPPGVLLGRCRPKPGSARDGPCAELLRSRW